MPGIEIKGRSKIANYRHGGRTGKFGGGRTNLLEQLGRVEAEPSNPNRRAEISRVHGELNRGYAKGGRAGFVHGFSTVKKFAKQYHKKKKLAEDTKKGKFPETESLTHQVGPYVGDVGSERKSTKWITKKDKPTEWITQKAERRRIGLRRRQGKVPRRSQPSHKETPPHKETKISSRLDSPRRKKGKYRSPNTPKPEWSLNKWGFKEGGKADKKR